jgi:hypothetical protein
MKRTASRNVTMDCQASRGLEPKPKCELRVLLLRSLSAEQFSAASTFVDISLNESSHIELCKVPGEIPAALLNPLQLGFVV